MATKVDIDPWAKPSLSLPTVLAANVQRMRKNKGWSQEELARRSWMTRQTVRSVELGDVDVRLSTVEQIALAFHVDSVALLRESKATRAYLHGITSLSPHLAIVSQRSRRRTTEVIQPALVNAIPR